MHQLVGISDYHSVAISVLLLSNRGCVSVMSTVTLTPRSPYSATTSPTCQLSLRIAVNCAVLLTLCANNRKEACDNKS